MRDLCISISIILLGMCCVSGVSAEPKPSEKLKACFDAVHKESPGKPDDDPWLATGLSCCNYWETVEQGQISWTDLERKWSNCVALFNQQKDAEGQSCVEALLPEAGRPPGMKIRYYEQAVLMQESARIRLTQLAGTFQRGCNRHYLFNKR